MVGNHFIENPVRPNPGKAFIAPIWFAVEYASLAIAENDIKAIIRQCPNLFHTFHQHDNLLSDWIDPHDVLALHAKFPVQHEFLRSHVYERLGVAQLPTRYLSCQYLTFWDRKHSFFISVQNIDMRSFVATVLFRVHVKNHTQKCRYSSHKAFLLLAHATYYTIFSAVSPLMRYVHV